VATYKGRRTKS